jgi:alkyl sulfatase BDS1-like metallo-beta-lactamase superfamily hydrolase
MSEENYLKRLLDKVMRIQDRYTAYFRPIYDEEEAEGRVGLLRIIGPDGSSFKLQLRNGLLQYAPQDAKPLHIIEITEDGFLSLLTGEIGIDECFDKKKARLIGYESGVLDIVEMMKWKRYFERTKNILEGMLHG